MARMARTRLLLPALLAFVVVAAAAAPASAYRNNTHPDPTWAFKKYQHARKNPWARASGFSSTFATTWPCTENTTGDLSPVTYSNAPQVKVIYAYPTDITDQFAGYKDLIQLDAKTVRDRFANPAAGDPVGSNKTTRYDT